jgi:hypothetical protein
MASHDGPSTETSPADAEIPTPLRSRRAILAAALGGLVGSVATALGRPLPAEAAAGDNLILGQTNYAGSAATRLNTTSSGGAFWMTQNGSGSGVRGDSTNGHGGVFTTGHPDRYGLSAANTAAAGTGAAISAAGGNNPGLAASTANAVGAAISAANTAASWGGGAAVLADGGNNIGLAASTADSGGSAISAFSTAASYGGGAAVLGDGGHNAGVRGISTSYNGVHGASTSGVGVYGYSGSSYGVYGHSDSSDAGYFDGSLYATSASASIKAFRIDHPLDPATKVLMHSCVESNERKLVYDGVVTTDAAGHATVTLPAWFSALNTDLRYQLTVIGRDARAWVKSKIKANRFTIATSEPGVEVCWMVTGVRADAYAVAHPLVVESAKTGREKGRYLNPVELGQPESKGIGRLPGRSADRT